MQQGEALKVFLKNKYGSDSPLLRFEAQYLEDGINKNLRQFHALWLLIWLLWLFLYAIMILAVVLKAFQVQYPTQLVNFMQDVLSIGTSTSMLFIYTMLTHKTVKRSANNMAKSDLGRVKIFAIILGFICVDLIANTLLANNPYYSQIIFSIRLVIGLYSVVTFMAVLGKLNSPYVQIQRRNMIILYIYASIQLLYPFGEEVMGGLFSHSNIVITLLTSVSFFCKIIFFYTISWILETGRLTYFILAQSNVSREEPAGFDEFDKLSLHMDG